MEYDVGYKISEANMQPFPYQKGFFRKTHDMMKPDEKGKPIEITSVVFDDGLILNFKYRPFDPDDLRYDKEKAEMLTKFVLSYAKEHGKFRFVFSEI